jgi:hypothetical protein
MQKWLNDLYTQILKNGFNPGGGGGGGGSHSGGGQGVLNGKYLGNTYTTEQKTSIANGSFNGLNIGDYWTINGVNYRIADFDYYYNVGDTAFTKHHVIIVPDTALYTAEMQSGSNTAVGYSQSAMYTTNLDDARTAFDNAFGSSFLPAHRGLYMSEVTSGTPKTWAWRDMRIELMAEEQVFGHAIWSVKTLTYGGYDVGTQKAQFRLFSLDKTKINIRQDYWLTNVTSSTKYAFMNQYGSSDSDVSTTKPHGVRPFACLVGDPE